LFNENNLPFKRLFKKLWTSGAFPRYFFLKKEPNELKVKLGGRREKELLLTNLFGTPKRRNNETTAKTTRGHHTKSEGSHFWKKKKMTRLLTATIKMVSFLLFFSAGFGALLGSSSAPSPAGEPR
jgi:hypothetical protein